MRSLQRPDMHLSQTHFDLLAALLALEHEQGRNAVEDVKETLRSQAFEPKPTLTVVR